MRSRSCRRATGFARELAARTERLPADDPERQVEALREFQKVAVFSVALADLTGRLPLMRVSDRLTDIAELIVQCCMDLAWGQMTEIYGVPHCGETRRATPRGQGRRRGLRQARRTGARLRFGSRSRVPARFERRDSADRRRAARSTTACSSCGSGSASCTCSPCIRPRDGCTRSTCVCGRTARADS